MLFSEKEDNAVLALTAFLQSLQAPVTATTARQRLTRHPKYPSLLAVTDCLREWRIEHAAARLQPEQLSQLSTPFFTQVNMDGGLFTVIRSVTEEDVEWLYTERGWQRESVADFKEKWVPVVLLAELSDASGEAEYSPRRRKERLAAAKPYLLMAALLVGVMLIGVLAVPSLEAAMSWPWYGLLLTKMLGTAVSVYLLGHLLSSRPLSAGFCGFHRKVDCNAVLSSKAATLWGGLSWAEMGFVYFAGSALSLLLAPASDLVRTTLWGLGLLALPYTLYSVYYQARVVKKWCTLCLIVQVLLVFDGFLLFSETPRWSGWNPVEAARLVLAFLAPALGWAILKPVLKRAIRKPSLQRELRQLQANPLVFAALIRNHKPLPLLPDELQAVRLGNPTADWTITAILSPGCGPCAATFAELERLLTIHDHLKAQVLFATSRADDDPNAAFVRRLNTLPAERRIQAVQAWYSQPENDLPTFPAIGAETSGHQMWETQQDWIARTAITAAPALFIDGFPLPLGYELRDVPYLLKYGPPKPTATSTPARGAHPVAVLS